MGGNGGGQAGRRIYWQLVCEGGGLPGGGKKEGARHGEVGTSCRLTVPGAGEHNRLLDRSSMWKDGWPDRGSSCPVEERRAHGSPFARRITSFPDMEGSAWADGRAQRGTAVTEMH